MDRNSPGEQEEGVFSPSIRSDECVGLLLLITMSVTLTLSILSLSAAAVLFFMA